MNCTACGAILSDDILAKLKLTKKVECSHCGNLMIWEGKDTFIDQVKCNICGGFISESKYDCSKLVCQYCFEDIENLDYNKINYEKIYEHINTIPESKLEEVSANLLSVMNSKEFEQLPPEQKSKFEEYAEKINSNLKKVVEANKWTIIRRAIQILGQGVGILIGFTAIGGVVGTAIGMVVSILGPALFKEGSP